MNFAKLLAVHSNSRKRINEPLEKKTDTWKQISISVEIEQFQIHSWMF